MATPPAALGLLLIIVSYVFGQKIMQETDEITIVKNADMTLVCEHDKNITWLFPPNFEDETTTWKVKNYYEEGKYSALLLMNRPGHVNTGFYHCCEVVSNDCDDSPSIYVYVRDPNELFADPKKFDIIQANEGDDIVIPCRPTSKDIQIELSRNGVKLEEGETDMFEKGYKSYDPRIGFVYGPVQVSDSDTFECSATRDNQQSTQTFQITVHRSTEGICITENIMDHIAKVIKKDPLQVRMANMAKDHPCIEMLEELKQSSDYESRVASIENFNKANRWRKRGISMVPSVFIFDHFSNFHAYVSVFRNDGTVAISQSSVEMGQGVNTKAAQVAAHILGIDVNLVKVKPIDSNIFPNSGLTGGSIGSESAGFAIKMACEELRDRLEPVRQKLGKDAAWIDIISEADKQGIDLSTKYMMAQIKDTLEDYNIFGVGVTEVEIDVLTGEHQIVRMDIIQDVGQSMSPEVDIGQVEGSLVMGLGLYTSEELKYHSETGRLLTTRTWNYKPPGAKDIPVDLRVTLKKNFPNPVGFMKSKAVGEPPFLLSCSVPFAIRHAIEAARMDAGNPEDEWFDMRLPFTREKIWMACSNNISDFKL